MAIVKVSNVKKHDVVLYNNQYYKVHATSISKPGKGGAYCVILGKNIHSGKKIEKRFSTSETIKLVEIHSKMLQFEYRDGKNMVLFSDEGDQYETEYTNKLFEEGMSFEVLFDSNENILKVNPPKEIIGTVLSATGRASAASKEQNVKLDKGITVKCPNYVKIGQKIAIKGENLEFLRVIR